MEKYDLEIIKHKRFNNTKTSLKDHFNYTTTLKIRPTF